MKLEEQKSYFDTYARQEFEIQAFSTSMLAKKKWLSIQKRQKTPDIMSLMCLRTSNLDIGRQGQLTSQKTNRLFLCGLFGSNLFFFDEDTPQQEVHLYDSISSDKREHVLLREEPLYYLKIEFARVKKIRVSGLWGFRLTLKGISHELILQSNPQFAQSI